jgi:hypothetical protein
MAGYASGMLAEETWQFATRTEPVVQRASARVRSWGRFSTCVSQTAYPSPLAERSLCRHTPEVGAVCGKAARRDLCGGRGVTRVPTANSIFCCDALWRLVAAPSGSAGMSGELTPPGPRSRSVLLSHREWRAA